MPVRLIKTFVTNLGARRRLEFLPPNGAYVDAFQTVEVPGLLDVYLYLAKIDKMLELYQHEQAAGLIDVVYEIDGITSGAGVLATSNIDMPAMTTVADGDQATGAPVLSIPTATTYVGVLVNGVAVKVADGPMQKTTRDCYFSDDGGVSARPYGDVDQGDYLYWNGSVAKYQLDPSDSISFSYISG